jgi:flagellar motor switch protein FliN/FliY
MSENVTIDAVARALSDALTTVCGAKLGGEATAAPSDLPQQVGWLLAIHVSGAAEGRVTIWFEGSSAAAYTRAIVGDAAEPPSEEIAAALIECVHDAINAVIALPDLPGVEFGAPSVTQAPPTAGSRAVYIAVPNTASCLFAVGVSKPTTVRRDDDHRLGAVLDVDLPLVVRFGQTVMALRDLAALGPGSVIDMGRSPDEPVEVFVGERLLARGDVVVVGGNYGVRITELAAGRDRAARKEMGAS